MDTNNQGQVTEPKVHTFSDEELASYVANIQKEKYDEGKAVAIEKTLRSLKQNYAEKLGIETEGIKDYDTLISRVAEKQTVKYQTELETLKKQLDGDKQLIASDYENKLKALQNTLLERETELNKVISDKENTLKSYKVMSELSKVVSNIQFAGEGEIPMLEKSKAEILFKSLYNIDFDAESGQLVVSDRNGVIKDRLQNPEKIEVIFQKFIKDYNIPVRQKETSTNYTGTKITQAEYAGTSLEKFQQSMQEQGIQRSSNEYINRYAEWKKANV